jgi:hypothetical protein
MGLKKTTKIFQSRYLVMWTRIETAIPAYKLYLSISLLGTTFGGMVMNYEFWRM